MTVSHMHIHLCARLTHLIPHIQQRWLTYFDCHPSTCTTFTTPINSLLANYCLFRHKCLRDFIAREQVASPRIERTHTARCTAPVSAQTPHMWWTRHRRSHRAPEVAAVTSYSATPPHSPLWPRRGLLCRCRPTQRSCLGPPPEGQPRHHQLLWSPCLSAR